MANIIGASALTFVLVAGYSGTLGLLMAHIIGASVLTSVLVAGFSGTLRDPWAPHGAYYLGLCTDICTYGGEGRKEGRAPDFALKSNNPRLTVGELAQKIISKV